jgi:hypothetical protein
MTQENRLNIDQNHRSWEDDSTGPKGENTEEAEVRIYHNLFILYNTFLDIKPSLETKSGNLWS